MRVLNIYSLAKRSFKFLWPFPQVCVPKVLKVLSLRKTLLYWIYSIILSWCILPSSHLLPGCEISPALVFSAPGIVTELPITQDKCEHYLFRRLSHLEVPEVISCVFLPALSVGAI